MARQSPDRSPLLVAAEWSSRVTSVVLQMVLPALVGYWLDQRFGTVALFVSLGAALGIGAATWNLVRLASPRTKGRK